MHACMLRHVETVMFKVINVLVIAAGKEYLEFPHVVDPIPLPSMASEAEASTGQVATITPSLRAL